MDANGQRFYLALGGQPWLPDEPGTFDRQPKTLRLASRTEAASYPEQASDAEPALLRVPTPTDAFGGFALFDPAISAVRASGSVKHQSASGQDRPERLSEMPILYPALGAVTDVALGADGWVFIAANGQLLIHDLHRRGAPIPPVSLPGFDVWRLAAPDSGGVWALDRTGRKLARIPTAPQPSPLDPPIPPSDAFVPTPPGPPPPVLLPVDWDWLAPNEDPVAIACRPDGTAAVLVWSGAGPSARAGVRLIDSRRRLGELASLNPLGITRPFSLAWLDSDRFALLAPGVPEAIVYPFRTGVIDAVGDVFPLRDHDGGPFTRGPGVAPGYLSRTEPGHPDGPILWTRPLVALSLPAFTLAAQGRLAAPFDSGAAATPWHRLYVEAHLPQGTGFTLYASASESEDAPDPVANPEHWHPHVFGQVASSPPATPHAAWVRKPSEIPGHPGFDDEPPQRDHRGLFTVLLQRSNRPVRTLRGRFLHLRIQLHGSLRNTPCLLAVRAYAPRFSYQDKYLPALYRESIFGPEADIVQPGVPSTAPDFLGRFLAITEGVLTQIEDSVASSWLLTDPRTTPDPALDWLGSWIGIAFEPWYPAARRRALLEHAAELARRRGTFPGLRLALDLVSGGAVSRGRIVIIEDFRFRRTLQTVLGIRLDRDYDPLLGGPLITGNSKVGETLFLGEETSAHKFLALFGASIDLKQADQAVVQDFFASLAHRVTIVIHEQTSPDERAVIERVATLEAPAHVVVNVRVSDRDFLLGLASLLGVESYLRPEPPPEPVEINFSALGDGSRLLRPVSLDPRLELAPG
jgi:phage tail-like protein